jgi:hypothetical protein
VPKFSERPEADLQTLVALCVGASVPQLGEAAWSRLVLLARRERCMGLAWWKSSRSILQLATQQVAERWRGAVTINSLRADARLELAGSVCARAAEQSIDVAVVRGVPLSHRLYGQPAIRPAGDVDLFANPEERGKLDAVLEQCGLRRVEVTYSGEGRYHRQIGDDLQSLEVHSNLLDESTMVFADLRVRSFVRADVESVAVMLPDVATEIVFLAMKLSCDGALRLLHAFDFSRAWEIASSSDRALAREIVRVLHLHKHLEWCLQFSTAVLESGQGNAAAMAYVAAARREFQVQRIMRLADGPRAKVRSLLGWLYPPDVRRRPQQAIVLLAERSMKLLRLLGGHRNWRDVDRPNRPS